MLKYRRLLNMAVRLAIRAEPIFAEKKLNCVAVYHFSPSIMLDPVRIPIMSQFSVLNYVFINSVALPSTYLIKNEIHNRDDCLSVFQLQNREFTQNAVLNKVGNYTLVLANRTTISSLVFAFYSVNAPCLNYESDMIRRNPYDITQFLPAPLFLLNYQLSIEMASTTFDVIQTTEKCVLNDYFFAIGNNNIMCQRANLTQIWFSRTQKLFQPADYIDLISEMVAKMGINPRELNFFVDAAAFEPEVFANFSILPMIDMENNYDQKYLEYYYTCLHALAGQVFMLPTSSLADKRALIILPEIAKLIVNRQLLTEEENEWNLFNTKLNWGVYCNASLPQLWSPNYEQQRAVTDEYVDYALKMGFMLMDGRATGAKWASTAFALGYFAPINVQYDSADIEKFIKTNIDGFVESYPEETTYKPGTKTLELLLCDYSYPRFENKHKTDYLRLRAKIIAYTIFNNSEEADTLLTHFLTKYSFDLPDFFRLISEFQCSMIMSTQAIGIGPDSNMQQYHKFYQVQSNNIVTAQQDKELMRTVFYLGFTNQTPRYLLLDRTDSYTDKSKFDLGVQNNSATNMFTGFIFNKLQIYDGVTITDNKIQKKQFEKGVIEKVCNIIVEKQTNYNYNSQWKQAMGIIDPNGCLPFLITSRYMSTLQDYKPVSTQMYPKDSKIQWNDGNIPYYSVIEVVVSFSKFYYEAFMGKLFEFMALHDFHLREIALAGIFRFYSQYNSEDYTYDSKNLQSQIYEYFFGIQGDKIRTESKINISYDCVFCLNVLFDYKYFQTAMNSDPSLIPNDYTIAMCAVLLGYVHMDSPYIFFDFIEYDYYQYSHNNVITLCSLYAMAWQMQAPKSKLSDRHKKRIIQLFYSIFINQDNLIIIRQSILKLLAFIFCCIDKDAIIDIFQEFKFSSKEVVCECYFCCEKEVVPITHLVGFFLQYECLEYSSTVKQCIEMLFTSHCPSYDNTSYFLSYIDPEFLLYLARPGEYYLRKCQDTSSLLAPNPALDWLIKDQYSYFMLTDYLKSLNIIYDCYFCYLGGSCSCSRSVMPRDKAWYLVQLMQTQNQNHEDQVIYTACKAPLYDTVNLFYRKPSAFTTNEYLSSDVNQTYPPYLVPLAEISADINHPWRASYQNKLKTFCSCGCYDGKQCLQMIFQRLSSAISAEERKYYLYIISNACMASFIEPNDYTTDFELHLQSVEYRAQTSFSRTLAIVKQAEDEASAIQNEKSLNCRIYEEEMNTWVYIEYFKQLDAALLGGKRAPEQQKVAFGCLGVI